MTPAGRVRLPAMCGIAGIIGSQSSVETVNAMSQLLRHRGPDGEGVWSSPGVVFGHRRLSILDLTEGGHQPMVLGANVLTYNGEIYNHEQLRATLPGPWHSSGDTEVLLHLLAQQGSACLERVIGMFAFALWDSHARRLLLARDRLGIKPLYYRILPDGIAFASELKALLLLGKPHIDRSAVRDFLFHGYVPAPKTIYLGIAKLPGRPHADLAGRACAMRAVLEPVDRDRGANHERYPGAARRVAARDRTGAHPVGCSGGRFLERRHRFGAYHLLPAGAAHL